MKIWIMTIIFINITLQDNLIKTFNNKKIEIHSYCYFSLKQSQAMVS